MNATGTLLVSHGVLIALLAGLLLRETPVNASTTNDVLAACEDIRRGLDDLQAIVLEAQKPVLPRHEPTERQPIPTRADDTASLSLPALDRLAEAIRSLEARVSKASTHLPNLDEIHESYPTTNWMGWEAYKQRCGMTNEVITAELEQEQTTEGKAKQRSKIAAALAEPLRLKRSKNILELFGSPSKIHIKDWGIVWSYQSHDGNEVFIVHFRHGFVTSLRSSLVDPSVLWQFR